MFRVAHGRVGLIIDRSKLRKSYVRPVSFHRDPKEKEMICFSGHAEMVSLTSNIVFPISI
jgi:hypothetical protein